MSRLVTVGTDVTSLGAELGGQTLDGHCGDHLNLLTLILHVHPLSNIPKRHPVDIFDHIYSFVH